MLESIITGTMTLGIFKNDIICDILEGSSTLCLHLAKLTIYVIFANRLYLVFNGSIYQYSFKFVFIPLYFALFGYYIHHYQSIYLNTLLMNHHG